VCGSNSLDVLDGAEEAAADLNQHTDPWVRAHAKIQRLKRATSPPARHDPTSDAPTDLAKQMERAVRTSAVVKLLSRSLLAGVLQPSRHLTIALRVGGANNTGTESARAAALPSKSVVSDLLDAIETNRAAPHRDAQRGPGAGGMGWWGLNVEGVMLLLRVVQAVRGKKPQLAAPAPREKRPRDEGPAGHDGLRGGHVVGGGGAVAFGGTAAAGRRSLGTPLAHAGALETRCVSTALFP
jgi:hypothetical protein